jgi:uncharacterized RDD family membrane protein YckC
MAAGVAAPLIGTRQEVHVTGRRILATLVDSVVFGLLYALMAALFGTFQTAEFGHWYATLPVIPTVVYGLIVVFYYVLMEGYLGQTVGKMVLDIKVVREGTGEVPGPKAAAIRTLLRVVDALFSYLVAFVTVVANEKRQRFGDMAAHTLVVHK